MSEIEINDLIGIPYKKNGRDKNGFDCYGYLLELAKRKGKTLPDLEEMKNDDVDFIKCLNDGKSLAEVKEAELPLHDDDIIIFDNMCGVAHHCGWYLGDGLFTHCDGHGVHCERISNRMRFIGGIYRWQ